MFKSELKYDFNNSKKWLQIAVFKAMCAIYILTLFAMI